MENIALKIRKIRELKRYSQEHMAEELNISQSKYSRFERYNADFTISQLKALATIFEVKIENLLGFEEIGRRTCTPTEKELYEKQISTLERELAYVKELLDNVVKK